MVDEKETVLLEAEVPDDTSSLDMGSIDDQRAESESKLTTSLKDAVTTSEKADIVRKYLSDNISNDESFLKDVEPLLGVIAQEAEELGLSESTLPTLTFIRNYFANQHKKLDMKQYIDLHNLYSWSYIDEEDLRGQGEDKLDTLIYNESFHTLPTDDKQKIAKVYYDYFDPKNIKLDNNINFRFNGKDYNTTEIKNNPSISKELRDSIIYKDSNTVRPYIAISKVINQLFGEKADQSSNKDKLNRLLKIIAARSNSLKGKEVDNNYYKHVLTALAVYFDLKSNSVDLFNNVKKNLTVKESDLDSYKDSSEYKDLSSIISSSEELVNKTNNPAIIKLLNDKITGKTKSEDESENTNKKEKSQRSDIAKAQSYANKLENLKKWCDDRIKNTKTNPGNVWRYIIKALSDFKFNSKDGKYSIADKQAKEDTDIYNSYINPAIDNYKFNDNRLNFFVNNDWFRRSVSKKLARDLIKWLYSTYKEI